MIHSAYRHYRASDASGVEVVPEHWTVKRIRFVAETNPSRHEVDLPVDALVSFIPMDAVGEYGGLSLDAERNLDEVGAGYTYFADNDVVIAKITPCFENGKGAIAAGLTNGAAFGTTELHVIRAGLELDPKFLFYVSVSEHFRKIGESEMYGAGGQKRIPDSFIKDFRAALPPVDEQRDIARFLDRETSRIDALIDRKRRLLALLEEKRLAVITQAVTKGLDPSAPMKDSGVEWLGEIPMHWDSWKLAHAFAIIGSGTTPNTSSGDYYDDGLIPWLNTGDLNDGELTNCGKSITSLAIAHHSTLKMYNPGSVVIAMYGATIGKLCILRFKTTVNQACCVFSDSQIILPEFLFYWFLGLRNRIISLASGGGQPNINQEVLRRLRVACPFSSEQSAITRFLDRETSKIDALIKKTQIAISLLLERRSALISAAVTGKIDLRDLAGSKEAPE